jgi:putative FmdB family regulatory protein
MPIYEFRCTRCGSIQEFLVTGSSAQIEMKCKECQGDELERVLSRVSYAMGTSNGETASPSVTTKTCGPGKSCSTIELPGYSK